MHNGENIPNAREAVILAVLLNGEKYGRAVRDEYEARTKRSFPLGALYVTLDRMEAKGLIKSRIGESTAERGGNRRKYFKITASGHSALNSFECLSNALRENC